MLATLPQIKSNRKTLAQFRSSLNMLTSLKNTWLTYRTNWENKWRNSNLLRTKINSKWLRCTIESERRFFLTWAYSKLLANKDGCFAHSQSTLWKDPVHLKIRPMTWLSFKRTKGRAKRYQQNKSTIKNTKTQVVCLNISKSAGLSVSNRTCSPIIKTTGWKNTIKIRNLLIWDSQ